MDFVLNFWKLFNFLVNNICDIRKSKRYKYAYDSYKSPFYPPIPRFTLEADTIPSFMNILKNTVSIYIHTPPTHTSCFTTNHTVFRDWSTLMCEELLHFCDYIVIQCTQVPNFKASTMLMHACYENSINVALCFCETFCSNANIPAGSITRTFTGRKSNCILTCVKHFKIPIPS